MHSVLSGLELVEPAAGPLHRQATAIGETVNLGVLAAANVAVRTQQWTMVRITDELCPQVVHTCAEIPPTGSPPTLPPSPATRAPGAVPVRR